MLRILTFIALLGFCCKTTYRPRIEFNGNDLCQANRKLLEIAMEDGFSPPQASRVYAYPHIAFYISLQSFFPDSLKKLQLAIPHLPTFPNPNQKIDPILTSLITFIYTAKNIVFSEQIMEDYLNQILKTAKERNFNDAEIEASRLQAQQFTNLIKDWIKKDNYQYTRTLERFTSTKLPNEWHETPPDYTQGLEPHWPKLRKLFLDSITIFNYQNLPPFSTKKTDEFYKIVEDVYNISNHLTEEQKLIASYWDDNPNVSKHQGHLSHVTHKISPPGHWLNIITQIAKKENWNTFQTTRALTFTAIAMFDGIIDCWKLKYQSKVIRPISYIHEHINPDWKPLIQTPPFPEFTSGHSVVSAAAAEVLTQLIGSDYQFNDSTEVLFGHDSRKFNSFHEAAMEVSYSRYYGGIHYKHSVLEGNRQGIFIAQQLLKKLN